MSRRYREMDATAVRIRAADARKNLEAAELYLAEASAEDWKLSGSCSVAAGIAAADAICGHALGYCALGQAHQDAITLLAKVNAPGSRISLDLRRLLNEKSLFQYGVERVTHRRATDLHAYARRVVNEMESALSR